MIGLDENYYQTNKQNLLNNLPSDYCSVFTNEHYDENNNMSLVEYVGCVIPSENGFHEFYVEISEREGLVYASDYSRIDEWTCQVSRPWVNCLN